MPLSTVTARCLSCQSQPLIRSVTPSPAPIPQRPRRRRSLTNCALPGWHQLAHSCTEAGQLGRREALASILALVGQLMGASSALADSAPKLRSTASKKACTLTIYNATDGSMDVFWLNYDGACQCSLHGLRERVGASAMPRAPSPPCQACTPHTLTCLPGKTARQTSSHICTASARLALRRHTCVSG